MCSIIPVTYVLEFGERVDSRYMDEGGGSVVYGRQRYLLTYKARGLVKVIAPRDACDIIGPTHYHTYVPRQILSCDI